MKRAGLKRGRPLQRHTPLPPASRKRQRENRVYAKLRAEFLTDDDGLPRRCEFPAGCTQPATDVHHMQGRVGVLLLDVTHWAALCRDCHRWVTENPAAAYNLSISERRIGGAA